jgi:hypothetical protein
MGSLDMDVRDMFLKSTIKIKNTQFKSILMISCKIAFRNRKIIV